ncbi:unnamed protein product [Ranitomeya imitator]|uniref:Metaxin-1 n=1 Tax=Ranitomeya imitator TaxID=111125 RepID=A0ABN9MFD2_9NEOB|nr:unnamed protein product [Ranitomeya imitator]
MLFPCRAVDGDVIQGKLVCLRRSRNKSKEDDDTVWRWEAPDPDLRSPSDPYRPWIHTFWVDAKNYVDHTRRWYSETIPFPLNLFIPNQIHKKHLERLQLIRGESWQEDDETAEKQLYTDAQECLTLLSQRLGMHQFFFGESPASLDAHIFSHLALILRVKLPSSRLHQHLRSLPNLCQYCSSILSIYFSQDGEIFPRISPKSPPTETPEYEEEPHKRRNQLLSVVMGLLAMISYALLSGIVSIQRGSGDRVVKKGLALEEEDDGKTRSLPLRRTMPSRKCAPVPQPPPKKRKMHLWLLMQTWAKSVPLVRRIFERVEPCSLATEARILKAKGLSDEVILTLQKSRKPAANAIYGKGRETSSDAAVVEGY